MHAHAHNRIVSTLFIAIIAVLALAPTAHAAPKRARVFSPLDGHRIVVRLQERYGRVPATWYGPGLWGGHLACGGRLRPRTWGIAHRTLPCGTLVRLRFHGRAVAVRVIDRGPFSGATIDLTRRTSDYLHFTSHGTGGVRMERVRRPRH